MPSRVEPLHTAILPDWTIHTLAAHFQQIAADLGKRLDDHFSGVEKMQEFQSSGTNIALKALEDRFATLVETSAAALSAALTANEKAALKAEAAIEKRFDGVQEKFNDMNEIRGAMADAAGSRPTRPEVESQMGALREKLDSIQSSSDGRLGALSSRLDKREGSGAGAQNLWIILGGAISLLLGMAGVGIAILRH